jgi:formamidopyrimidine-DNA glycosylase
VPELPEVETVRSQLAPVLAGRTFASVEILDERLTRPIDPRIVEAQLEGERVASVDRRGKYVVVRFDSDLVLLVHLRMTGSFLVARSGAALPLDPHRRAVVRLDDGSEVAYRDVRRFGTWLVLEADELTGYLAERLGEEPLSPRFTVRHLSRRLAGRRAPVKAVLLDQRAVAGIGNIYADEALWYARVDPLRPASELDGEEVAAVRRGIRHALRVGIRRQGATLSDYRTPNGGSGAMQDEFKVYGRDGEPCLRCGAAIAKTRVAGRGTSYCPVCQR